MNIRNYLHLSYDFTNINGVSCFGLYAKIMNDVFNISDLGKPSELDKSIKTPSTQEAAAAFAVHIKDIETENSNFVELKDPENYCFVIMHMKKRNLDIYHCGMWYNKKIIHAKGKGKIGKVWYESPSKLKEFEMRFFRYVN